MLKTGLEFAPNTSEECQRLVTKLFEPRQLFEWYRAARRTFQTGDIVLVTSESDPSGTSAKPRMQYVKKTRENTGRNAPAVLGLLTIAKKTAHSIVQLPFEADAFWLVIERQGAPQVMAVLFAMPYETGDAVREPTIGATN